MGARFYSLACASALLLAGRTARADATGYRLELVRAQGTGSCVGASELARAVTQRLGRDPFSEAAERGIEIVMEREATTWRARLYLRIDDTTEDHARVLESEAADCAELSKAVVLAVALALAPELQPEPSRPTPPPEEPPPCAPAPQPPPAPPSHTLHGTAALRALFSPNLLPRSTAGASLSVTLRGDLFGIHVGGLFYPQRTLEASGARLGFGLSAALLSGCIWARHRDPELWSCLGAQVGALHTVVYSPQPAHPGDRIWSAASAELGVRQSLLGRTFVEAGAAAIFPFVRHRFAVAGADGLRGIAFEPPGAALEAFVGLGLRLD